MTGSMIKPALTPFTLGGAMYAQKGTAGRLLKTARIIITASFTGRSELKKLWQRLCPDIILLKTTHCTCGRSVRVGKIPIQTRLKYVILGNGTHTDYGLNLSEKASPLCHKCMLTRQVPNPTDYTFMLFSPDDSLIKWLLWNGENLLERILTLILVQDQYKQKRVFHMLQSMSRNRALSTISVVTGFELIRLESKANGYAEETGVLLYPKEIFENYDAIPIKRIVDIAPWY